MPEATPPTLLTALKRLGKKQKCKMCGQFFMLPEASKNALLQGMRAVDIATGNYTVACGCSFCGEHEPGYITEVQDV